MRLIVRVNVVLNRTDSDWRFDNLCSSHLQSQSELYHVSWWYYTLVIDLIGQLRCDVIGRLSVKPWCYWLWRLVIGASRSVYCLSQTVVYCELTYPPGFLLLCYGSFFLIFSALTCSFPVIAELNEKAVKNKPLKILKWIFALTASQVPEARAPTPVNTDTNELIELAAPILASTISSPGDFNERCYDMNDTRTKQRPCKVDITNFNTAGRS